jgi:hypothetical protein
MAYPMADQQTRDLVATVPLSVAIARRYLDEEQAESFGARNAVEGELLARVRPSKIVALDDLAG